MIKHFPLNENLQKAHRFILSDVVHIQIPIKGAVSDKNFNGVVIIFLFVQSNALFLFSYLFSYLFSTY